MTPDSSVVVDLSLTNRIEVLLELFAGRMLLSDFVEAELLEAAIHFEGVEVVKLETDQEWNFYARVRKTKPGLGTGELGALTAQFRQATLLTNDKPARLMADSLGIPYSGGIGVLEFAVQFGRLSGTEAVQILDDMIEAGARLSDDPVSNFR